MSAADVHPGGRGGHGGHSATSSGSSTGFSGTLIRPAPVTEKSLMESVAGFINEVQQPGSFSSGNGGDSQKVHVTWAKFEVADLNDPKMFPDGCEVSGSSPPLILVLGYTSGVQVWLIPINGEAQELLSWKQGSVKTLAIMPTPEKCFGLPDNFAFCRPMIALSDSTGPGMPFTSASFISLKTGEQVHNIKFNSEIADILVNRRVVVTTFKEKLAVFDACALEARFTITTCYPSPGVSVNPVALGDRWLAYAERKLVSIHKSFGGLETDSSQSMAAWGINVTSKLAQGVSKIYSNFFSSPSSMNANVSSTSSAPSSFHNPRSPNQNSNSGTGRNADGNEPQKGVVTILDVMSVYKTEREEVNVGEKIDGIIAHFIAHNKAIVALQFDHSGSLLMTCDRLGNYFNLFRVVPHPAGSCYTAIHHLYALYRGDTIGTVQDISFSPDSRWVTISTLRGTTHIFPITPYGGPVGVRTHTSSRVVNRLSRFHRSAGIDEQRTSSSGRNSPNPNLAGTSPVSSSFGKMSLDYHQMSGGISPSGPPLILAYPNPHLPPYPTPTLVQPVAQLRQPYIVTLTNQTIGSATGVARKKSLNLNSPSSAEEVPIRLACTFAPSRAWLVGTQHNMFNRQQRRAHDALFVMANHGVLLEYSLDAIPESTLSKDKICESSPIELIVNAYGQWSLTQPRDRTELQPPLPIDNPLRLPARPSNRNSLLSQFPYQPVTKKDLDENEEEKWLSQVEIVTHFGPHRRLWMGPQFAFKTLQPVADGNEEEVCDLDISLPNRPDQSNPVPTPHGGQEKGRVPVLIEAGSASSFEWSPRFSNSFSRHHSGGSGNRSTSIKEIHDVESELQEAMSDTVQGEESLLDGSRKSSSTSTSSASFKKKFQEPEEEFFCLTPEDARSLGSNPRSRNSSQSSAQQQKQTTMQETKIFSVAVEDRKTDRKKSSENLKTKDVDGARFSAKFAVVMNDNEKALQNTLPLPVPRSMKEEKNETEKTAQQQNTGMKKGKNNKKKKKGSKGSSASSNDDTEGENLAVVEADVRETTPKMEEEIAEELSVDEVPKRGKALKSTCEELELENPDLVSLIDSARIEDNEDAASDSFMEISNRKVDSDPEEEEEPFTIREDTESPKPSEDGGDMISFDPETSGKPSIPKWVDDILKSESTDTILKGIEKSENLWSTSSKKNSGSTGFDLDLQMFPSLGAAASSSSTRQVDESSEDDFDLRPTLFGSRGKKNKNKSSEYKTPSGSFADSESSLMMEEKCNKSNVGSAAKEEKEGWSFEADDLDVNQIISEVDNNPEEEEKTPLEDVFKFDSELGTGEDDEAGNDDDNVGTRYRKVQKSTSLDFEDKSENDEEEESNNNRNKNENGNKSKRMAASLNLESSQDSNNSGVGRDSSGLSTSVGSTSESSVGNSPNPKKNNQKKKKKKRK